MSPALHPIPPGLWLAHDVPPELVVVDDHVRGR
jgi:hypothetical protein